MFAKKNKILYSDWIYEWLIEKKEYIKESTYANYSNNIFNHIIPKLGNIYIQDLNHKIIQDFLLNLFKIIPTVCTIFVEFLFAISFPIAFPPTVIAATKALIINCILNVSSKVSVIFTDIMALIAPLKTPHISPTTSAQKFATFAAFFIRCIDAFEPFTFFVAFA